MMWRISPALLALVLLGAMAGAEAQEKLVLACFHSQWPSLN
jgi:hypothetical protein